MCVIAIIMILVGMMMGPIMRAYKRVKDFEGEVQSPPFMAEIHSALSRFCEDYAEYKPLTPQELVQIGVFDGNIAAFLRTPGVRYHPFSSTDPDTKIVVEVNKSKKAVYVLRKGDFKR